MLTYLFEWMRDEKPVLFRRLWNWMESQGYELCEYFHDFGCPCDCSMTAPRVSQSLAA